MGLTLIGFLRGTSMNIYSGAERIPSGQDQAMAR
jgi:formate dehydrogenase assembly factor FdhD